MPVARLPRLPPPLATAAGSTRVDRVRRVRRRPHPPGPPRRRLASAAAAPAAPRPLRAGPAPAADDSIDLGATVLPVLVKNYAPYAVAGLVGLVLGWLIGRRNS